jgi:hypothetical protein
MSKQTAVEFLIEEVECRGITTKELKLAFEQAKEMEEQQTIYAYVIGAKNQIYGVDLSGLEYYNKTFKD